MWFFHKKQSTYAARKSKKLARMKEKLAILEMENKIEHLKATRENKDIRQKAEKFDGMTDLMQAVDDFRNAAAPQRKDILESILENPSFQPIISGLISKFVGIPLDVNNPLVRAQVQNKVMEIADKHPEKIEQAMKAFKRGKA